MTPAIRRPWPDTLKGFIGELARPFAIISTSAAASWATVVVAYKVQDGNDGAIFIGGVFAGVGALYIGKAVEVFKSNRAAAEVEIAKVSTTPPPGTATITAAPDVDVTVRDASDPADAGELPPDQRVRP